MQCNVGKRGWMNGIGGCPNVGGICIGCTMPGFPDKFMPFMDMPPGAQLSTAAVADLRPDDPRPAPVHAGVDEPGAVVAPSVTVLEGIRVLTLAVNLPGPLAAAQLAGSAPRCSRSSRPAATRWLAPGRSGTNGCARDSRSWRRPEGEGRGQLDEWLDRCDLLLTATRPAALRPPGAGPGHRPAAVTPDFARWPSWATRPRGRNCPATT